MAGFAQFAKPLVVETIIEELNSRISTYTRNYEMFFKAVESLKKFDGKSVSGNRKRITDKLKADFPGYNVSLEFIGSMIYLNIWGNGIEYNDRTHFFMCYTSEHSDKGIYHEKNFIESSHITNLPELIQKSKLGLKGVPALVKRYNQLLKDSQKLVEDAEEFGLEYTFDIVSVNR